MKLPTVKFKTRPKWVYVVMCVLVAGGWVVVKQRNSKPKYETARVAKGTVVQVVTETGTVTTTGQTDIYSPTNGTVTKMEVANGDAVKEGQELFEVKSSATETEQQTALATYLAAKAKMNAAEAAAQSLRATMYTAWDTYYGMATSDTYAESNGTPKESERLAAEFQEAQSTWLSAEKNYKDQQTAIAAAKAGVAAGWLSYQATQDAVVKATADGVVANLAADMGETVAAGVPGGTVRPVLLLVDSGEIWFEVLLGQSDIAKVQPGQHIAIVPDAYAETTYHGTVERVDAVGTNISGVEKYYVYAKLSDADEKLKAGMSADATIETERIDNVLSVPNAAVKLYKGERAVRVPGKKELEYVPVVIGIKGAERTEILSGLSEGQEVVVALTNEQIKRPSMLGF